MAYIRGHSPVAFGTAQPAVAATQGPTPSSPAFNRAAGTTIVNGAPVRIVVLALAAATGLTVLKLAGFKFNVAGSFK